MQPDWECAGGQEPKSTHGRSAWDPPESVKGIPSYHTVWHRSEIPCAQNENVKCHSAEALGPCFERSWDSRHWLQFETESSQSLGPWGMCAPPVWAVWAGTGGNGSSLLPA